MSDQANALRDLMELRHSRSLDEPAIPTASNARTIVVTSGKGGVGKTNIALNLAIALSNLDASVCLLDANSGLGNVDLLCGLNGYWNFSHVITGARTLPEVLLNGPNGIQVVPGASGIDDIADCPPSAQQEIYRQFEEFEHSQDFIVIDTGTSNHRAVCRFARAADVILVLSTPEPTSIADAYATIKLLSAVEIPTIQFLINQAESSQQARAIIDRLQQTSRLFLHSDVGSSGYIPTDPHVVKAVAARKPFLVETPHAPASRAVQQLARRMKNLTASRLSTGGFFAKFRESLSTTRV